MTKDDDRIKRLQKSEIVTDEKAGRQFIANETLTNCIRELQIKLDEWNLRPLEKEIVIMLLGKYEKDRQISKKQSDFMNKNVGGLLGKLGLK